MKKITTIAMIAALAITVSGCDFIRSIAGRPTSSQIQEMDEAELVEEAQEAPCCNADTLCCGDTLCCPDSLCCTQMPCDSCVKDCGKSCKEVEKACCELEKACAEVEKACGEIEKSCEKACEEKTCEAKPVVEPAPVEKPCEAKPVVEPAPVEKPCEAKPACEKKPVCEAKPAREAKPKAAPRKAVRIFTGPVCKKAVLENKYYVIIGTFKVESNVDAQVKRAEKAGYKAVTIPFANCLTAVAVNPTDCQKEALNTLDEVKCKKFCPKDAYVLVIK